MFNRVRVSVLYGAILLCGAVAAGCAGSGTTSPSVVAPKPVDTPPATTSAAGVTQSAPRRVETDSGAQGRRARVVTSQEVSAFAGGSVSVQWQDGCQNCNGYYISWASSSRTGFSAGFDPATTSPGGITTETVYISANVAQGQYTLSTSDTACKAATVPPSCLQSPSDSLIIDVFNATPPPTPKPSGPGPLQRGDATAVATSATSFRITSTDPTGGTGHGYVVSYYFQGNFDGIPGCASIPVTTPCDVTMFNSGTPLEPGGAYNLVPRYGDSSGTQIWGGLFFAYLPPA